MSDDDKKPGVHPAILAKREAEDRAERERRAREAAEARRRQEESYQRSLAEAEERRLKAAEQREELERLRAERPEARERIVHKIHQAAATPKSITTNEKGERVVYKSSLKNRILDTVTSFRNARVLSAENPNRRNLQQYRNPALNDAVEMAKRTAEEEGYGAEFGEREAHSFAFGGSDKFAKIRQAVSGFDRITDKIQDSSILGSFRMGRNIQYRAGQLARARNRIGEFLGGGNDGAGEWGEGEGSQSSGGRGGTGKTATLLERIKEGIQYMAGGTSLAHVKKAVEDLSNQTKRAEDKARNTKERLASSNITNPNPNTPKSSGVGGEEGGGVAGLAKDVVGDVATDFLEKKVGGMLGKKGGLVRNTMASVKRGLRKSSAGRSLMRRTGSTGIGKTLTKLIGSGKGGTAASVLSKGGKAASVLSKGGALAGLAGGGSKVLGVAGKVAAPLAAAVSLYEGQKYWRSAGEKLGENQGDVSTGMKASMAAGGAVKALTLGLIDPVKWAEKSNSKLLAGDAEKISKAEDRLKAKGVAMNPDGTWAPTVKKQSSEGSTAKMLNVKPSLSATEGSTAKMLNVKPSLSATEMAYGTGPTTKKGDGSMDKMNQNMEKLIKVTEVSAASARKPMQHQTQQAAPAPVVLPVGASSGGGGGKGPTVVALSADVDDVSLALLNSTFFSHMS